MKSIHPLVKAFRHTAIVVLLCFGLLQNLLSQKNQQYTDELIKTDTEFSDYSVRNGMNKAFFEFADEGVVLLKPGMMPLKGMEALKEYHSKIDDSTFTLSWTPLYARAAEKGDLGYTFGTWKVKGGNFESEGTYVTIWARDKEGNWKFVLDTGNDGLGTEK